MSETKRFTVHLTGVASTVVRVEVSASGLGPDEIKAAAIEAALMEGVPGLCHQCGRHMEAPDEWHAGNWTMQPENPDEYVEEVHS